MARDKVEVAEEAESPELEREYTQQELMAALKPKAD